MKRILLFCILVIGIINSAKAQNTPYRDTLPWAPEGATWVYSGSPNMTIKYAHDSIINGQDVKVLKFYTLRRDSSFYPIPRPYIEYAGEEYLYNSNDSVFFYDQGLEAFVLLYDFNAQEGDTWDVNTSYLECLSNTAIDTRRLFATLENSTTIMNNTIEYYAINSTSNSNIYYPKIVPNIGNTGWFFPYYNRDSCSTSQWKYINYDVSTLTCYTDPIRGRLIQGRPPYNVQSDSICTANMNLVDEFIISVDKVSLADNKNDKFSIYPNPAHSALNVYTNGVFFKEIMIYDAVGKLVIHDKSQSQNIDISSLNNGLYIINILDDNYQISAFKFVKA